MVKGHGKNLPNMGVIQRIIDYPSLLSAFNDPGNFQQPQLVADGALGHIQQRREVTYTHFLDVQRTDDSGTGGVSEYLEQFRNFIDGLLGRHLFAYPGQNVLMNDGNLTGFHHVFFR